MTPSSSSSSRPSRAAVAVTPDPVDRLLSGADAYVSFAERYPHRYAVMHNYNLLTPDRAEHGAPDQGRALEYCIATVEDCVAVGRSASTHPFRDSVAIWSGLHGYASLL